MVEAILILIALAFIGLLIVAAMQPAEFCITRSCSMDAPPTAVFQHINNLHNWDAWSPWAKLDPNAKNLFEGPPEGQGAKMSWAGNNKVGVGSMTLQESRSPEFIKFKLEFQKPMQATNTA